MLKKILPLIVFLGLMPALIVQAQPKIGYMDSQKVMQNLPQRKNVQKKLTAFAQQENKKYTQKATNYQKALSKYTKNKPSMSKAEVDTTEKKLTSMKASLNKLGVELRQQIQQKRSELVNPILQKINAAIVTIAKKDGLDFVLNKSTNQGGSVIYYASSDQKDITQQVIDHVKSNSKK
jgi:outer membrane protein